MNRSRWGSITCEHMLISAIDRLKAALAKRELLTPTFRAALSRFISIMGL